MPWVKFALTLLRIVSVAMSWAQRQGAINEGERRQLAREMASITRSANMANQLRDEIAGLPEDELNEILVG